MRAYTSIARVGGAQGAARLQDPVCASGWIVESGFRNPESGIRLRPMGYAVTGGHGSGRGNLQFGIFNLQLGGWAGARIR
jgi:hypothetical protein